MTKQEGFDFLKSAWPHVADLIQKGDIKGAIHNYVHCGCYIGLSKKARATAESWATMKQKEIRDSEEAIAHSEITDAMCYGYRKNPSKGLLKEIERRRQEWIYLYGRYGHFHNIAIQSEHAKVFCHKFRHQLFG